MTGPEHHTSAATMADALRELADRLDATWVRDLPPVWLQVNMQVVMWTFEPGVGRRVTPLDERRAAVDTIAAHLDLPAPDGAPESTYGSSARLVNVYTGNREAS